MSKFLWKALLAGPAALGATLAISTSASAAEALVNAEALEEQALETSELALQLDTAESVELDASAELDAIELEAAPIEIAQQTSTLEQIEEYNSEGQAPLPQVTSITQFSDVQPTDWAYSALQSLVERYGCVAGYPDGTFRGNRAMTRYEAAALLNACLDRVLEVIDGGGDVDLTEINRLLDEFQAELATLRGRVDSLEARTAELEANQFSTTTKLAGQIITFAGGTIDEDAAFAGQDQIQLGYRVRLNFDTSFTGEDRLRTRFQAREADPSDALQVSPATGELSFSGGGSNDFILDDLYYEFPLGSRIFAKVGFNSQSGDDWVASTISPVDSASSGTLHDFGGPAQYDFDAGDLGAGLIFQLSDNISIDVGYSGEDSTPNTGAALFNGDYSAYGQITFLSDFIDAALTYANAFSDGGFFGGLAAAGAGTPTEANVFGGQVNVKLGAVEVGGGVAYADLDRFAGNPDSEAWSWQGTVALPDFGGEGNLLGALVGMPLRLENDDNESFLVEGFYKFQVTDNISVTPSVIWIQDPGPNDGLDDTIAGYIRTTFSF